MSKIQFNELNQKASELEVLNKDETAEVVGGGYYYGYPYYSYYSSYSYYSDDDVAIVNQGNSNYTQQVSFGAYKGNTGNSNYTGQGNSAYIYQ